MAATAKKAETMYGQTDWELLELGVCPQISKVDPATSGETKSRPYPEHAAIQDLAIGSRLRLTLLLKLALPKANTRLSVDPIRK